MQTYSKYIIVRILGPMALICFSLTSIIWLTQSLRFIDLIVNRGLNLTTFLYFSSLMLPALLWIILPISLFIAVTITYNRLTSDSEMVIFKGAGVNRMGLIRPALYLASFTVLLTYLVGLYLLPTSYREFKDLQVFIRDNYVSLLLQEGVFNTPIDGLTVYIRERDRNGTLSGMIVHDSRTPGKETTMMAREGQLIKTPTGPRFIMIDGNRQEVGADKKQLSLLFFDKYDLDLSLYVKPGTDRWREPQERYINELIFPEDGNEHLWPKLKAEAHHRLTWPLFNVLLTLVALVPFVTGEFNRRGQGKRLVAANVTTASLVVFGLGLNGIVANNNNLIWVMYAIPILGTAGVFYFLLFFRGFKKKLPEGGF